MGYLDGAGLAYFWKKVRTALAGKQNLITAGDGISKTGDSISVSAPIRGIVTQEEFDALPEEQQNSGLYVIPGGANGDDSVAGGSYSTEETRIGTWIDGKPLYRIVLVEEYNKQGQYIAINRDISVLNAETIVSVRSITWGDTAIYPSGYYQSANEYFNISIIEKSLRFRGQAVGRYAQRIYSVLEYTKTTDEGDTV